MQDYLVKFSLTQFQKIPSRGRIQVASERVGSIVQLTALCQALFLMHGLEPTRDHIWIGAKARAFAPQLNSNLAVANAINKTAGDDFSANRQRVECYSLALLGCFNHCKVRHLLNNARNQG